ncbi:pantoate--beta-alanine ligase [Neomegalonema perideroedes]|uniref:pantoate--beta-alanine ligase n=1 Tax=Neomegalonema perideroedes TaxID=217219 RepID=UPI00037CA8AD|nr:pantoate--beta-alanine ligase [Neomegalonema perideroedes]
MVDSVFAPLPIVRTAADLRAKVRRWRAEGERVALVPTMGALHDGHLSLIEAARREAERVVASVFVNPTQFAPHEDFSAYPRQEAEDARLLARVECDLLYAPTVQEMYPVDFATIVSVGEVTETLCGAKRPGHFDGVATVVAKLFNQALPDVAVFGEKDWQQLTMIRRMVRDLDMPVRILGVPTFREADGLAMSSRNRYLTPEERRIAGKLNKALAGAAAYVARGAPAEAASEAAAQALREAGFAKIDYLEVRDAENLAPVKVWDPARPARIFAAAHLGKARLIDNLPIGSP